MDGRCWRILYWWGLLVRLSLLDVIDTRLVTTVKTETKERLCTMCRSGGVDEPCLEVVVVHDCHKRTR